MVSRLVLGCGTIGQAIIDAVADWEGSLYVLESDAGRVESLRNDGVDARETDLADAESVARHERPADVVIVATDDAETNRRAARAAAEVYPDAVLVAYAGDDPDEATYADLTAIADRVVDPGRALGTHLHDVVESEAGTRTRALRAALRAVDGTLGVFMHDNPDPDAIASAIALAKLAESAGVEAVPCYFGEISHQENRAFVNLLDLSLRNVESDDDLDEFDAFALVDHSRPGVNDQLPEDTPIDIVVDHHPPKMPVEARFVDLREDVGATSTLMADHINRFGIDLETEVATGLLYGIRVDTKDFTREVSTADFEAAAFLLSAADTGVLERVESPSMSRETLATIARAIRNRQIEGRVLASCVGALSDRDSLAQAADRLLTMEGITTTLVYGFMDGTIYVSARSRGADIDLGEVLRSAFGRIGSAGGHADMAGAQIPLGLLGEVEEEEEASLTDIVRDTITERFFAVVRRPGEYGAPEERDTEKTDDGPIVTAEPDESE